MAAERRDHESASPPADVAEPRRGSRSGFGRGLERDSVPAVGDEPDRHRSVPLRARIERTRLEFRVRALERALETSERRRQAVIDRYERLLADRTASADDASTTDEAERSDSGSVLTRLLER